MVTIWRLPWFRSAFRIPRPRLVPLSAKRESEVAPQIRIATAKMGHEHASQRSGWDGRCPSGSRRNGPQGEPGCREHKVGCVFERAADSAEHSCYAHRPANATIPRLWRFREEYLGDVRASCCRDSAGRGEAKPQDRGCEGWPHCRGGGPERHCGAAGQEPTRRGLALDCGVGRQGCFAGSFVRAARTASEPVRTPKMPFSTVII
jgi:hypothetical protein